MQLCFVYSGNQGNTVSLLFISATCWQRVNLSRQQTTHPDAFLILAGDFNHADLRSVFPKIHQHIDFPTRGKNTLDFVYTTQRGAYKALPIPHLRAGDEEGLKTARANLSRGIREAKRQYSRRIAHRFSDSRDTWSLWQGIQTITDYKPPPQTCDSTIPLLNELNAFFARFEAQTAPLHRRLHLLPATR